MPSSVSSVALGIGSLAAVWAAAPGSTCNEHSRARLGQAAPIQSTLEPSKRSGPGWGRTEIQDSVRVYRTGRSTADRPTVGRIYGIYIRYMIIQLYDFYARASHTATPAILGGR